MSEAERHTCAERERERERETRTHKRNKGSMRFPPHHHPTKKKKFAVVVSVECKSELRVCKLFSIKSSGVKQK